MAAAQYNADNAFEITPSTATEGVTFSKPALKIDSNRDISFFEDTGTTAKFSWSSANETIAIGSGASSTATISAYSRTVSANLPSALRIIENTGASSYWDIGSNNGSSPNLNFYANANTTPKVTFASSGNVGIGTSSPAQTLHLKSADPVIRLEDSSPDGVYAQIDGAGGGLILSADGGNGSASSFIGFRVDGTASGSEKMRIDSSGRMSVSALAVQILSLRYIKPVQTQT
jgi:hypothetical protein